MIEQFLTRAKKGYPVFITEVQDRFESADSTEHIFCVLELLDGRESCFSLKIPVLKQQDIEKRQFIKEYIYAKIYNILSALGGKQMDLYCNLNNPQTADMLRHLETVYGIALPRQEREGYGRCINVIDRMIENICGPESPPFRFNIKDISERPELAAGKTGDSRESIISKFQKIPNMAENRIICGIDIGGSDIKICTIKENRIVCLKEFDWFPAGFTRIKQIIEPILLLLRLMRAKISFDSYRDKLQKKNKKLSHLLERALESDSGEKEILNAVATVEAALNEDMLRFDAIGLCFPDVVVRNKIVGGEVYKTRGIRNNPDIDYEAEFKKLSDLDKKLQDFCGEGGKVCMINDGPMAAFTAAVETAASESSSDIQDGVFAYALGTELGTGWVDDAGAIPEIPLEVYNFIIDLGNYPARQYDVDDLRSINNFNTGLPGTLQKYTCQSGVYRLAMRKVKEQNSELFDEFFKKGFVIRDDTGGTTNLFISTDPVDQRKPFLEYLMSAAETEDNGTIQNIFRELGEYLAVTTIETERILAPKVKNRILFGRLVKNKRCFELMVEGAKKLKPDIELKAAGGSMANTTFMKQLQNNKEYTVAQFAQSVGAVYYAAAAFSDTEGVFGGADSPNCEKPGL